MCQQKKLAGIVAQPRNVASLSFVCGVDLERLLAVVEALWDGQSEGSQGSFFP
jgi:hypothetical protein